MAGEQVHFASPPVTCRQPLLGPSTLGVLKWQIRLWWKGCQALGLSPGRSFSSGPRTPAFIHDAHGLPCCPVLR